ncbi:MAG: hypothetical protein U0V03_07560 [Bacteroidia bacterium]
MKIYLKISLFYLLLTFSGIGYSQNITIPIISSNAILYKSNLFVVGVNKEKTQFLKIFKYSTKIQAIDSLSIPLKGYKKYTSIDIDTIHNYLNIYLQEEGKKIVSIYRLDNKLKLLSFLEDEDLTKVNALTRFTHDYFYFKNDLFTIKKTQDSMGFSFYLNKYTNINSSKINQYSKEWQFPFDRKNIQSVKIYNVVLDRVCCYVNINNGKNKGQWFLQICANTGKLLHANKLNYNSNNFYCFGALKFDSLNNSFSLVGQKLSDKQFNSNTNILAIKNHTILELYMQNIDTSANVTDQLEFKMPINDIKLIKPGIKKVENAYLFNISNYYGSLEEGVLKLEINLFKNDNNTNCFKYCNTQTKSINFGPDFEIDKTKLSTNLDIEKFYFNTDNKDLTGTLCFDSVANFCEWYYQKTPNVKLNYGLDNQAQSFWYLKKMDFKTNFQIISKLNVVGKSYKLNSVKSTLQFKSSICIDDKIIILTENEEGSFIELFK